GFVLNGATVHGAGQFAIIQSVAPSVGVDVSSINLSKAPEIERAIKPDRRVISTANASKCAIIFSTQSKRCSLRSKKWNRPPLRTYHWDICHAVEIAVLANSGDGRRARAC